ncbi:MAG TPA: carboxymuconolactone decarboxylase family protein [Steroidobacter sp.]
MARLPYPDIQRPELRTLVERIRAQRGSVLHLYHMLLHSPPIAAGWLHYLTAIRHECELPAQLRELAIMRIAILNGASYESDQHAPIARAAGISDPQLSALVNWPENAAMFDVDQRAVLAYTDAMTLQVQVPDDVFADVRSRLDNRKLVELTATIAAYNMVSRFLEALRLHSDDPEL